MSTVQNIIDRAVERSNLNDVDLIPADELYAYVTAFERRVFLTAARLNPDFFGKEGATATRGSASGTWNIANTPGNVAAVSRIEVQTLAGTPAGLTAGDEVNLISIRNPQTALAPRAYLRNRVLYEYGTDLQDDASNYVSALYIYYSHLPSERTAGGTSLDLPSEFDPLVVLPLARLMALRDQRPDEVPAIDAEFELDWSTFVQQVSVYDEAAVRDVLGVGADMGAMGAPTDG